MERSVWVRAYLKRHGTKGHYENLMRELALKDPHLYRNFLCLDKDLSMEIMERMCPHIEKETTFWREPLHVGPCRAVTLRYLATGIAYMSIGYAFRVAPNTISKIVPETCRAIITKYGDEVLQLPTTPEGWKDVARGFQERWHFPHTIGALDGKHIHITNSFFLVAPITTTTKNISPSSCLLSLTQTTSSCTWMSV